MNPSRKTSKNTGRKSARGRLSAVLLTLAAVLCAIALFGACNEPSLPSPSTPVPVYDLDIVYDGDRSVTLREDIYLVNDGSETLEDIALHLYANAFSEGNPSPPYASGEEDDFFFGEPNFGNIRILSAKINGSITFPFDFDIFRPCSSRTSA